MTCLRLVLGRDPIPLANPHIDVTTSECSVRHGVTSSGIKALYRDRHQGEMRRSA